MANMGTTKYPNPAEATQFRYSEVELVSITLFSKSDLQMHIRKSRKKKKRKKSVTWTMKDKPCL